MCAAGHPATEEQAADRPAPAEAPSIALVGHERMPLLLVPGAFSSGDDFEPMASWFYASGWDSRVVRLPARARRVPQLDRGGLAAIDAMLDEAVAACKEPPVVVGHSLGGLATLRLSRRTQLPAAVLLTPATPYGLAPHLLRTGVRDPLTAMKFGALATAAPLARAVPLGPPAGLFTPAASRDVVRRSLAHRVSESWLVLAQLLVGDPTPQPPADQPTLVLGGTLDTLAPPASVRQLADDLTADYVERVVGHAFYEEPALDAIAAEVDAWLRRVGVVPATGRAERRRYR